MYQRQTDSTTRTTSAHMPTVPAAARPMAVEKSAMTTKMALTTAASRRTGSSTRHTWDGPSCATDANLWGPAAMPPGVRLRCAQPEARPTIGAFSGWPPMEPWKGAPKAKSPPSEAASK